MQKRSLLFLGDSITDADHLWTKDPKCLGTGFVKRISQRLESSGFYCINKGQDGFTSCDLLRLIKREALPSDLFAITILIGVNDLPLWYYTDDQWMAKKYAPNLEQILEDLRGRFSGEIYVIEPFLFPHPEEFTWFLPGLGKEHDILQTAAEKWNGIYIPIQEQMLQAARKHGQERISTDGIHLTDQGNQMLAEKWWDVFRHKHDRDGIER